MYFRYDLEYIPRLLRKIKFVTDLKLREENVFQAGRIHDLKFLSIDGVLKMIYYLVVVPLMIMGLFASNLKINTNQKIF